MSTTEAPRVRHESAPAPHQQLEPIADRASAPAASAEIVHGALGCPSVDELAQQDICAALLATPGLDARYIEVEMTAAGVLLRGKIVRPDDRAWALQIARRRAAPRPVREALTLLSSSAVGTPPHRAPRAREATDAA
jgi:hypothetical protein